MRPPPPDAVWRADLRVCANRCRPPHAPKTWHTLVRLRFDDGTAGPVTARCIECGAGDPDATIGPTEHWHRPDEPCWRRQPGGWSCRKFSIEHGDHRDTCMFAIWLRETPPYRLAARPTL